ncbi:MAG: BrnA antitoxin family protein [Polaromonas sp.]|uniref:BrnA antitoxin family protein n=1 Tax=Polaromonas sp. TaxID=1869339 RepID=UPI00403570C5
MKSEIDFSGGKRGAASPGTGKTRITIMLDDDVLEHFRTAAQASGTGYQTMINRALRNALSKDQDKIRVENVGRVANLRQAIFSAHVAQLKGMPDDYGTHTYPAHPGYTVSVPQMVMEPGVFYQPLKTSHARMSHLQELEGLLTGVSSSGEAPMQLIATLEAIDRAVSNLKKVLNLDTDSRHSEAHIQVPGRVTVK